MTERTPGPWHIKRTTGYHVIAGDEAEPYTVANCWSGPFAPARPIAHANARLIAAAPDLLAACKEALPHLVNEPAANAVRDAIAKAEGHP